MQPTQTILFTDQDASVDAISRVREQCLNYGWTVVINKTGTDANGKVIIETSQDGSVWFPYIDPEICTENGIIANSEILLDEDDIIDSKSKLIQVDIVIDRIVLREDQRSRIADSLELTFSEGAQQAIVLVDKGKSSWKEVKLSMELSCEICGQIFPAPSAKMFSWNHPDGACESCGGTGETLQFRAELCVPDGSKSTKNGAIKPWRLGSKQMIIKRNAILKQLAEQLPFDPDCPWDELKRETQNQILYGIENKELPRCTAY